MRGPTSRRLTTRLGNARSNSLHSAFRARLRLTLPSVQPLTLSTTNSSQPRTHMMMSTTHTTDQQRHQANENEAAVAAATAPSTSSSKPPSASITPASDSTIDYIAVYGTLRDDDDSGAEWTGRFVGDIHSAYSGVVEGATMYWNTELNYPFVCLHPDLLKHQNQLSDSSPPSFPSRVHVRLLRWCEKEGGGIPAHKLAAADEIENYDPDHEDTSEYVRRKVNVTMFDHETGQHRIVQAYMYVMQPEAKPLSSWIQLPHGDWMKRDRTIRPNTVLRDANDDASESAPVARV